MAQATKTLKVGDKVRFWLGSTPVAGTILFAMGTNAAAVQLDSGKELCVDLSTIH